MTTLRIHQNTSNPHKLSRLKSSFHFHTLRQFSISKAHFCTTTLFVLISRNIFHHTQFFLENSFVPLLYHCRFCLPFTILVTPPVFCLCGLIMCLRMVHFRISTSAIHFSFLFSSRLSIPMMELYRAHCTFNERQSNRCERKWKGWDACGVGIVRA
jgi:hypothetical protein